MLFGDGAGALLLNAVSESGPMQRGILSTHLHSDGRQHDILYVDGGPSSTRETGYLRMQGREVFRQAVHHLSSVVDEALAANGLAPSDIDWLVPHQANTRIIEAVVINVSNTSFGNVNEKLYSAVLTADQVLYAVSIASVGGLVLIFLYRRLSSER